MILEPRDIAKNIEYLLLEVETSLIFDDANIERLRQKAHRLIDDFFEAHRKELEL